MRILRTVFQIRIYSDEMSDYRGNQQHEHIRILLRQYREFGFIPHLTAPMTQEESLEILKLGYSVFLTGGAGVGKTYVLDRYMSYLKRTGKKYGVTASTGVAATHLGGITINSWAGIGIKKSISETEIVELLKRKYLRRRMKDLDVLIIDEVSMLPSYTFEIVDKVLRAFTRSDEPFGGIQLVLSGDFFQLPPVGSEKDFLYKSTLWETMDLKICYLDTPFRQNDEKLLDLLTDIRQNNITKETWNVLKKRFLEGTHVSIPLTKLYTHNDRADLVNQKELAKLPGPTHIYRMRSEGSDSLVTFMKRSCLAQEQLVVRREALVMFVKNNFEKGFVNGTIGKIVDFSQEGNPVVEIFSGKTIEVMRSEWTIEEDGIVKAKLTQIPLRLAWAITIHKSQGMTLDAAEIDLGRSFTPGLGYVALSRVRSLAGLKLVSLNRTALQTNNEVIEFDKHLKEASESTVSQLRSSPYYQQNKKFYQ